MLYTESRNYGPLDDHWYNPIGIPVSAGVEISEHNALYNSDVYKCVELISTTIATAPLITYKRLDRGKDRATNHKYYDLLRYRANKTMTAARWRQLAMGHVLTWGNHYSFKIRDKSNQITGFFPMNPSRMEIYWDEKKDKISYVYKLPSGKEVKYFRDRILHLYGFGFDGLKGYSPIALQREGIGLSKAARIAAAKFYGNNATPGGLLTTDKRLNKDQTDAIKKDWKAIHEGPENFHELAVLDQNLKWQVVGLPPKDAEYLQTGKWTGIDIAGWYRVPPELIGYVDTGTSWGTGVEQRQIAFGMYTIEPWMVNLEQDFQLQLFGNSKMHFCEFLMDNTLRADVKSRAELIRTEFNAAGISPNEIRALGNRNPMPGGDEVFVPLNMVPLSMAKELAETVVEEGGADQPEGLPERGVRKSQLLLTKRSSDKRKQISNSYLGTFKDAAQRVVNSEIREVRKAVKKNLQRDTESFDAWLEDFYFNHAGFIRDLLSPIWLQYAYAIRAVVAVETGQPEAVPEKFEEFAKKFIDTYSNRHAATNRKHLSKTMRDAIERGEDAGQAINDLLDHWRDTRAEIMATHDVVEGDSAFATYAYVLAGYRQKVWQTRGDSCPYCKALDGKVIGIEAPYLSPDTPFEPEGADHALHVGGMRKYPPAHKNCDCSIGGIA